MGDKEYDNICQFHLRRVLDAIFPPKTEKPEKVLELMAGSGRHWELLNRKFLEVHMVE